MDLVENGGGGHGGGGGGGRRREVEEPQGIIKFTYTHVSRPISHVVLGH